MPARSYTAKYGGKKCVSVFSVMMPPMEILSLLIRAETSTYFFLHSFLPLGRRHYNVSTPPGWAVSPPSCYIQTLRHKALHLVHYVAALRLSTQVDGNITRPSKNQITVAKSPTLTVPVNVSPAFPAFLRHGGKDWKCAKAGRNVCVTTGDVFFAR